MANNDKLLQIISNIQVLNDLTKGMLDSEMYPVSFFSQACDLMQRIQRDLNTIEAEQVEMFAAQLKKHQELIFSIHQQMRHISTQHQALEKSVITPAVSKKPVIMPAAPEKAAYVPAAPPESSENVPVYQEKPETVPTHQEKLVAPPETTFPDAAPSINDIIEKNKFSDLRRAFSVNDSFRYRKELFGGSEENMNKTMLTLNSKKSLRESIEFLEQKFHWDFNNPVVKDFIKILEIRFL